MSDLRMCDIAANGEDYLCHHGVKGMKWGQHLFGKDKSSGSGRGKRATTNEDRINALKARLAERSSARKVKRAERAEVNKAKREAKAEEARNLKTRRRSDRLSKKDILKLSDEELKQHTERLKLEKEFKEAYDAAHPNKKYIIDALKSVGTQIAKDPNVYVNALKGLDYLIRKTTPELDVARENRKAQEIKSKNDAADRDFKLKLNDRKREDDAAADKRKYADNQAQREHERSESRAQREHEQWQTQVRTSEEQAKRSDAREKREYAQFEAREKREHEITLQAISKLDDSAGRAWATSFLSGPILYDDLD